MHFNTLLLNCFAYIKFLIYVISSFIHYPIIGFNLFQLVVSMSHSSQTAWDNELVQKYNYSGPRYTSYPTAVQFSEGLDLEELSSSIEALAKGDRPLSLYLHIPFCAHLCYYCACNKVVTKRHDKAAPYLARLYQEIEDKGRLYESKRMVEQMHWGGGTPTFLNEDEIHSLINHLRAYFNLLDNDHGDYSVEIDPRECTRQKLHLLRYEGFNRISIGVQDFDEKVQKAVNRVQPIKLVEDLVDRARHIKFKSINMDLIYGLPFQTAATFEKTVNRIIELSPDRLSVFNYAHLPERFKSQRRLNPEDLPAPEVKLEIMQNTISQLEEAGYVYIGMDHFAKPTDELAISQKQGQLHRNFQGYTTHKDCDLIAMGVSSISHIGPYIFQNHPNLDNYIKAVDAGKIPALKGIKTNKDDQIRSDVITQLICHFELDMDQKSKQHKIDFSQYFADEMERLKPFIEDGLLKIENNRIEVLSSGRLLIRSICMVFDAYLPKDSDTKSFSRII